MKVCTPAKAHRILVCLTSYNHELSECEEEGRQRFARAEGISDKGAREL